MTVQLRKISLFAVILTITWGCSDNERLFTKLNMAQAGIDFENKLTPTTDFNIIDYLYFYNGGGVAAGDINGDGLPDLFFSGNQVKNRLYLNKGNLTFEDITESAGVAGKSTWNTGSVMADVNGDGLLDIYVCAVVGLKHLQGHNELFINNGDNTFTEMSAEYGLDFDSFSSAVAFLDYDLDGDLDIYLLNHAVHTPESFAHASSRNQRSYESGDKLLRNDGGKFVDVSEAAGIFGGPTGYGLGVAVSDFNLDGYPDIYVGNDFHEDDYLYINQGNGTFKEVAREAFTISSKFSMGCDVTDINHDGFPDLITLDMLPADERVLKRSDADENIAILRMRTRDYGYGYQFQRNMLQINQGDGTFVETALVSNVAATDWSWSALFCDFDHDGHQDLFISNGIPRRPNDLDYIKYVSNESVVNTIGNTKLVDSKAIAMMPSGKIQNYVFKGTGSLRFNDMSNAWLPLEQTCSSAAAYADLDNDGDLDVIVNNVDDAPGIYINQKRGDNGYVKIRLRGIDRNTHGIGARVSCYSNGLMQVKEMYTARGFQSSSEPVLHFGVGDASVIDSVIVVWPTGKVQSINTVKPNQTIEIAESREVSNSRLSVTSGNPARIFTTVDPATLGLRFRHREDDYTDFNRLKLLPYQHSDRGPATAVGDLNNDGLTDIFIGGSKHITSAIFLNGPDGFYKARVPSIQKDSIKEDVDAIIADLTGDGKMELLVGTGGADFFNRSSPLLDSYYVQNDSGFVLNEIGNYQNTSCVRVFDYDGDGDLDVFIGAQSISSDFGRIPVSMLWENDGGSFVTVQEDVFSKLGMVTDAVWEDFDGDGQTDLVVVGEWMAPVFLRNQNGVFKMEKRLLEDIRGLWQSVSAFDIDGDGDTDFILGNWGLNSKFRASEKYPMRMYYGDLDENGQSETVLAIAKSGKYFPLDPFDMLASQLVSLRKKYQSYESFAGKTVSEVFSKEQLGRATLYEVKELASGYLENVDGKYSFVPFPDDLQLAPIIAQLKYDFDGDGREEVLLGGNYFGVQPFHGRFGSFGGALIKGKADILSGRHAGLQFINQSVRHLNIIRHGNEEFLLVTINNGYLQTYKLERK